jgi:alpha-galactosidase
MKKPEHLKITIIGAGSMSFSPPTLRDILLNENLNSVPLEICLMDILEEPLKVSRAYAAAVAEKLARKAVITTTLSLEEALKGAAFVVTAIEKDRYHYWSQDFHIPRKYGCNQIYGENGGPGGMFHTLRNLVPMLEIARAMERICPNAWLINYSNPEAKLIEAISTLTKIKCVGLCHGVGMGVEQLSYFLEIPPEDLDVAACGLNHFGWFQTIKNKKTGADLYPLLKEKERKANWLANWDEIALSRIMLRTYGLYPYPGANHIGEYIRWSEQFLAGAMMQYFYDPASESPWESGAKTPEFVYSAAHLRERPLFSTHQPADIDYDSESHFIVKEEDLVPSDEVGIPIIESIAFDIPRELLAVNMSNKGKIPGLADEMVVELPASVDGKGIHPKQMAALPDAITEMIRIQGVIHKLVIEAYVEQSRNKLLQAVLLDPTVSTYNNSVEMINEMCEVQKEILPPLNWK